MDIATIIGVLACIGLIIMSIGTEHLHSFWDLPSVYIVFGGTFGALLIAYPLREVLGIIGILKKTVLVKSASSGDVIKMLVDFSNKARRDGILALEEASKTIEDQFLARGIQLAVDGQEPDSIETILSLEIEAIQSRHRLGADILTMMGNFAPSMGMIGTLIGLVMMLENMSDPSAIGPAMAMALVGTLYGAAVANMVCMPLSTKLKTRSQDEIGIKELMREGIMAIAAGDNPRIVEQKLHAYLQPKKRESSFE